MNLTLEDIGRLAGVSRSTVSRVVNDEASVSPDVRARVWEVIQRTGYTPNAAARSLVSGRSGVIGVVIPSRVHSLFEDPYFPRLIQGISAASNQRNLLLTLFIFQTEEEESELYTRVVTSGMLDGLIITATRMGDRLLAQMTFSELPIVMVGRPDIEGVSYVDADNAGGARRVALHLSSLGYRRIGLIGAPTSTTAGVDRLNGFVEGLAMSGQVLHPTLRVDGDYSETSGYLAMRELIPRSPEAVFVASDTMAMGAMRALREAGIRVPEDMAIAGFDDMPSAQTSMPPLTTIHQPVSETGARSLLLLDNLIKGTVTRPTAEILPVTLVVRDSCGAHRRGFEAEPGLAAPAGGNS